MKKLDVSITKKRIAKLQYMMDQHKRSNTIKQEGNLYTFYFNPDELGVRVFAPLDQVDKLGLERAWERLNREDFYRYGSIRLQGNPNKNQLTEARQLVLTRIKNSITKPVDLTGITTVNGEVTNETVSG